MYIRSVFLCLCVFLIFFFFSSRRRHTRCALVTGVQTCALPIYAGTKILTIRADNEARGLPTIGGFFVFFDAATGATLATMDAAELTARRTAAGSALASRQLTRPDASRLLMIGAGKLVPHLAEAHAAVRPLQRNNIWARKIGRAHV